MSKFNNPYERLIALSKDGQLFNRGEYFNKDKFKQQLINKKLIDKFNAIYLIDTNCTGDWLMWDFSDRFARFAKALCTVGYCQKVATGCYIKL